MGVSAELRWFWKHQCPEHIEQWFNRGLVKSGGGSRVRVDRYVQALGNDNVGIKIRDSQKGVAPDVEIKGLLRNLDGRSFGFGSQDVELWCKWKVPQLPIEARLATEKIRWLRKFSLDDSGVVEIALDENECRIDGKPNPEVGCNLEFTRIRVHNHETFWWTLCFESFGDIEKTTLAALEKTIRAVEPLPAIDGALLSYPAWLKLFHST